MKTYKISGFGNYSYSFGWDEGIRLSTPVETEEVFEPSNRFMGEYVNEVFANEHGGSRNIDLLVRAFDAEDARIYAEIYCSRYYPEYDQEEDEDD